MKQELAAKWLDLNSLTDTTLALAFAGELNGQAFSEQMYEIAELRKEVLQLIYQERTNDEVQ